MSDDMARSAATRTDHSVIVQAPAGSGKTTLLVERYLGLLATVQEPEEILAITFTRKAANEMRERVLRYLDPDFHSDAEHEQAPLARAREVSNKVAAWQLLANPQRLMIRTIDSFNHYLARTMPVASSLGPVPAPANNAQALYRVTARQVLQLLDGDNELSEDVARVLRWRDHRSQDIENVVAQLLARREQWLGALGTSGEPRREHFEATLHELVAGRMEDSCRIIERGLANSSEGIYGTCELLRFAAATLIADGRKSPTIVLQGLEQLPDPDPQSLQQWQALAGAMLTTKNELRKQVQKGDGFHPKTDEKQRFTALLSTISEQPDTIAALVDITALPQPVYDDEEWQVLASLIRLLRHAAVRQQLVFAARGQTDYAGLAAAALQGLGDAETGYTDLGLYMDSRIKHLLVDEFQDTNTGQLALLEKLTAGWSPDDGRTLFAVGDPMQSIYRFREAEVGLFIRSREQGIGDVRLQSLQLQRNFRARAEIVEWVNQHIGPIFPDRENIAEGAVCYAASQPGRKTGGRVELAAYSDETAEAKSLVAQVRAALQANADNEDFSAAILVRNRSHLREIIPELQRQQVPFRAIKLDPLATRPVVQDLLAVTRLILQPHDNTALLALLRAPVCGLTLEELHALAGDGRSPFDTDALQRLPTSARTRASRVFETMELISTLTHRRPLRELVQGAWTRLEGPACCETTPTRVREAQRFLEVLDEAEQDGLLRDWNDFEELLEQQFTEGDPPDDQTRLEVLTMHSAKGLEWDLVVLPALQRRPPNEKSDLLNWLPFVARDDQEHILLSPLRSAAEPSNPPLTRLILSEQRKRVAFETQRLLYVAATRAREHLILSACIELKAKQELSDYKPPAHSLLSQLWPTLSEDFRTAAGQWAAPSQTGSDENAAATPAASPLPDQSLRRIREGWRSDYPAPVDWQPRLTPAEQQIEVNYDWAGVDARRTGTVLHRLLEAAGTLGAEHIDPDRRRQLCSRIPLLVRSAGVAADDIEQISAWVGDAFESTLDNEAGRWILSAVHTEAACELAISGIVDGRLVNAIVDRTFVDEHGCRWIIDYKSGYHEGADVDAFIDAEAERYADQLLRYKRLFEQLESRPVKTALYLPRHGVLRTIHG